jgi:hypothetical protein
MSAPKKRRQDQDQAERPKVDTEALKRRLRESAERHRREREERRRSFEESEQRCSICRIPWPDDSYGCRSAVDEYDQAACHVRVDLLCDECCVVGQKVTKRTPSELYLL